MGDGAWSGRCGDEVNVSMGVLDVGVGASG